MALLPKTITYLAIAAFLLAGTLTGHHGHLDLGKSHSSGHGADTMAPVAPDRPHDHTGGQDDIDKTSCDFAHFASCGMGQCCFPVPTFELAYDKGVTPFWALDILALERREEPLEPPPPKWS